MSADSVGECRYAVVRHALTEVAAGRPVIVIDEDRGGVADVIVAGEKATPELISFMVRHTSGFVNVALLEEECVRFELPPMPHTGKDTDYRVTVDRCGTGTGISASCRSQTISALADPHSTPSDFTRPGHVVPVRGRADGVLDRATRIEAGIDLPRLAGLRPVSGLCEIVSADRPGELAVGNELERFSENNHLAMISITDLVEYRKYTEPQATRIVETSLPTAQGKYRTLGYRGVHDSAEILALVTGSVQGSHNVPVHIHCECVIGEVFGSTACRCADDLAETSRSIFAMGCGVIIYVRNEKSVFTCGQAGGSDQDAEYAVAILKDLETVSVRPLMTSSAQCTLLRKNGLIADSAPPHDIEEDRLVGSI